MESCPPKAKPSNIGNAVLESNVNLKSVHHRQTPSNSAKPRVSRQ